MESDKRQQGLSWLFIGTLGLFILLSIAGLWSTSSALLTVVVLCGWVISLGLHEWSHACMAYLYGDFSVMDRGYLSLNFLKYMDPVSSLLFPILLLGMGGIALPGGSVLIQKAALPSSKAEMFVSLAGPCANLIFGYFLRVILLLVSRSSSTAVKDNALTMSFTLLIFFQGMAFVLNLLPLPPLDGWGVISPWLGATNSFKTWLNQSHWNYKTASILTFCFIYCLFSLTSAPMYLTKGLTAAYQLDPDALAQGMRRFVLIPA